MLDKKKLKLIEVLRETIYKRISRLSKISNLEGPNVLVLSPHPDDDILGCGGTLHKHVTQKHNVTVVYLCNGASGIKKEMPLKVKIDTRMNEAKNAATILGITNLIFLGETDYKLTDNEATVAQIREILEKVDPDIVYLPSFLENHPDHVKTNRIFALACKNGKINPKIAAYEVWTAIIPNRIVDITKEVLIKLKSIKKHRSQLEELDYAKAILSLNCYRAKMFCDREMEYAETFIFASAKSYNKIAKKFLF